MHERIGLELLKAEAAQTKNEAKLEALETKPLLGREEAKNDPFMFNPERGESESKLWLDLNWNG